MCGFGVDVLSGFIKVSSRTSSTGDDEASGTGGRNSSQANAAKSGGIREKNIGFNDLGYGLGITEGKGKEGRGGLSPR